MKKLVGILSIFLLATSLTACSGGRGQEASCDPAEMDGTTVCYADGQFAIETGAKLRFATDTDAYGNAIVALWDKTYPEHAGAVEFVNVGASGSADELATQQGEYPDVFMAIDGEVPRNSGHTLTLDQALVDIIKANAPESFYNAGNVDKPVYAPITYDGMSFVWNKTMLETLGYDTTDADGDGLPEAFDTWEEIFALSSEWAADRPTYKGNKVNVVFPLTLDNQWADYFHLASAGWEIYKDGATEPGYDTPEFKAGFDFMLAAKDAKIAVDESGNVKPAASMSWLFDNVISEEIAPFGMFGTWMDINSAPEGTELVLSALPTWNDNHTTPFVKTKGFVINGYTQYRSAASALMAIVYSAEGVQAMVDNSGYAPALQDGSALAPNLTTGSVQEALGKAFTYHFPEPGLMLPNNNKVKAMDASFYPFISDTEKAIWDGTQTVDEAIAELIELSNAKIAEENK
ncbi:MAG: extracellular solute-binding protein [Erysipelotrichaceae bacterium]